MTSSNPNCLPKSSFPNTLYTGGCMYVKLPQSCLILYDPMDCSPSVSYVNGIFPGKNTGVDCYALLQGIFPTQGSNPCLLHLAGVFFTTEASGKPLRLQRDSSDLWSLTCASSVIDESQAIARPGERLTEAT